MRRARFALAAVLMTAACHHAPPASAPSPVGVASVATAGDVAADSLRDTASVRSPEVTGEALQMFGDTLAPADSPRVTPDSAAAPDDSEPTWDIDVRSFETRKRVTYFIDRYENTAHDRFGQFLARGGRYEPMIRAKLRAAGLPEDLTYLALIESGYDPQAYSSAAAVGIWQLMTSTARGAGLRVDWWVDERRDPVRATDGAIKFLGWLHEQFGSLYLAAAAYNGGPGRVSRGLTRYADELEGQSGDEAFFALAEKDYLRAETRDYVPRLIAAALIAKDPRRYGFDIQYDSAFAYDSVRVGPATPLAAVADAAHTSVGRILELNPGVLRGMTPPRDSFSVRVPVGSAEGFDSAFAALPRLDRTAYTRGVTHKRETITHLARRADVTVKQLKWFNPKLKPDRHGRLPTGVTVMLPAHAVVMAARDVPDPAIERYGSSRGAVSHVVRAGESLGLIARRNHTTVKAIMRLNGLRKSIIFPGQVLLVKGSHRRIRHRPAVATRAHRTGARIHVVQRGESLSSIAHRYDTTVKALKDLNGLDRDVLQVGQRLVIRG